MEFLVEVTKFVVESSDEGVYAMSGGNRILTFNRRFCELMGLPESAIEVGSDATEAARALPGSWRRTPTPWSGHLADGRERPFDQLATDFELKTAG